MMCSPAKCGLPLLILALLFPACLQAETVPMRNGSVLEGELIQVVDGIALIRLEKGEIRVPQAEIDKAWLEKRLAPPAPPAPQPESEPTQAVLEARIRALEAEVRELRARLTLLETGPAAPPASAPAPVPPPSQPPLAVASVPAPLTGTVASGYWLSSTGVRHNQKCRYYMKSRGQPARPGEGRACSRCGG